MSAAHEFQQVYHSIARLSLQIQSYTLGFGYLYNTSYCRLSGSHPIDFQSIYDLVGRTRYGHNISIVTEKASSI